MFLKLLFFYSFTFVIFTTQSMIIKSLDLNKNLKPFHDCNIILVQIVLKDKPNSMHELTPLEFPHSQITLPYNRPSIPTYEFNLVYCDDTDYNILDTSQFPLRKTANKNKFLMNCQVLLYLSPRPCRIWHRKFIPPSTTSRTVTPLILSQWLSAIQGVEEPTVGGIDSHRYTIVVGNVDTLREFHELNIFSALDYHWAEPTTHSVKLFYAIDWENPAEIGKVYLVLFPDIGAKVRNYVNCKHRENGSWKAIKCLDILGQITYMYKEKSVTSTSRAELEKIVFDSFLTTFQAWVSICQNCKSFENSRNRHIPHTTVMREWRGRPNVETMILYLLTPNSTVYTTSDVLSTEFPNLMILESADATPMYSKISVEHYYFVTCADVATVGRLRLAGYISAFDCLTWFWMMGMSVFTAVVLAKVLRKRKISDVVALPFYLLMEQAYVNYIIPWSCRWITGAWFLVSIVLVNLYRGDNITDLTAPLPPRRLQTFDELAQHNFSYFSTIFGPQGLEMLSIACPEEDEGNEISQSRTPVYNLCDVPGGGYPVAIDGIISKYNLSKIERNLRRPNTLRENSAYSNPGYFIRKMSKCEKYAFIGLYTQALEVYSGMKTNLSGKTGADATVMNKEPGVTSSVFWKLARISAPAHHWFIRLDGLTQSGIVSQWEAWSQRISTFKWKQIVALDEFNSRQPKRLNLKHNVVVVFYLYVILLALSAIVIFLECIPSLLELIWEMIQVIKLCFRSLVHKLFSNKKKGVAKLFKPSRQW